MTFSVYIWQSANAMQICIVVKKQAKLILKKNICIILRTEVINFAFGLKKGLKWKRSVFRTKNKLLKINKMSWINKPNDWKKKNQFFATKMSLVKFLAYVFRLFRKQENYHVIYPKSYDDILEVSFQHLIKVKMFVYFLIPPFLTRFYEGPCIIRISGVDLWSLLTMFCIQDWNESLTGPRLV